MPQPRSVCAASGTTRPESANAGGTASRKRAKSQAIVCSARRIAVAAVAKVSIKMIAIIMLPRLPPLPSLNEASRFRASAFTSDREDHDLEVHYDRSDMMFITTANRFNIAPSDRKIGHVFLGDAARIHVRIRSPDRPPTTAPVLCLKGDHDIGRSLPILPCFRRPVGRGEHLALLRHSSIGEGSLSGTADGRRRFWSGVARQPSQLHARFGAIVDMWGPLLRPFRRSAGPVATTAPGGCCSGSGRSSCCTKKISARSWPTATHPPGNPKSAPTASILTPAPMRPDD